jgi:hypothetical protein
LIVVNIPDTSVSSSNAGINTQTASGFVAPALHKEEAIESALSAIGATDTAQIDTSYVAGFSGKIADQLGQYQAYINPATRQFMYGKLTIKLGTTGNQLNTMVAHEYLHHIWYSKLDTAAKERLTSDLIVMYGNDQGMQTRVLSYASSGILEPTELFSYYCTEFSDQFLTSFVRDKCNTYINRDSLMLQR